MSSERRNRSEIIYNNLITKDQIDPSKLRDLNFSKKGYIMEETNDNIFDSIIFPEGLHKKTEFNFDDNLSLDNKFKVNKNIIKVITGKFHELFLKIVCENKNLRNELQIIKKEQIEFNYSDKKQEANTTNEKSIKFNNTNNNINIGNLSLQDLHYGIVKEKKNESFDENEFFSQFKEEETEVFNAIVNDFNIQINELESKDDFLRREIHKKLEEISRLNTENEEIIRKKEHILSEIQNISLKLCEYKAFLQSLPKNFVKKDDTVLIHSEIDSEEKMNSFTVKRKDEMETYFETQNAEELNLLINKDNQNYVLRRLYEENVILKEVVRKLKYDALKCENEIISLEREFSVINKIKNNLVELINNCDKGIKELLNILDTIKSKYGKFVFYINEKDFILEN
jgi:hypothetical protein